MSALPELAQVSWRPRTTDASLARRGRLWTAITVAHALPFLAVAGLFVALKPLLAPISLIALGFAWAIPELYAARGAKVLRAARGAGGEAETATAGKAENVAAGLLGDLLDHEPRALHARTGLVVERGVLGVWILGEAGAVLVRPGARRVYAYCVKATDRELPSSDRIAHLLLALRADEAGFATLANLAFSGARWRLSRRLSRPQREALAAAAQQARQLHSKPVGTASPSATL